MWDEGENKAQAVCSVYIDAFPLPTNTLCQADL